MQLIPYLFIAFVVIAFLYFVPFNTWITATFSGVKVSLMELVCLRIRRSPVNQIVNAMIVCQKTGIPIELQQLEVHAIAGGNVESVVKTCIKANQKGIHANFREICAWDLAGWNMDDMLRNKANSEESQNLKIDILNKVDSLSERELVELQSFMSQFR
tara:strand:- start:2732 stop:3205 length:474 start_codon:yes stop_codon:yes gene_type:complete